MNSPTNRLNCRPSRRAGFTLTELLVVIAIIGLLVGMLAVALGPAIWTTDEYVITQEVVQLDAAIEKFEEKYGFYPPDFTYITSAADMAPYLNKISRNHGEFSQFPAGHPREFEVRAEVWWEVYGQYLPTNRQASLVFWLSHLFNNSQFPLTAGIDNSEFDTYFDFKNERLGEVQPGYVDTSGSVPFRMPGVYVFYQAKGPQIPYAYFNHTAYASNQIGPPQGGMVPSNGFAAPYLKDSTNGIFFKPESFQIIAAGLDGEFGPGDWILNADPAHKGDQDNITNFAEGVNAKLLQ